MIYPRLYLARNLLREDGVIFISIDDNEVLNLRRLCDEIFGEENFFSQIIIRANSRGQTFKQIAKTHEYLLVYTKNFETELLELEKEGKKDDLNLEDEIGHFNIRELRNRNPKFGRRNRPNLFYSIFVNPNVADDEDFSPISLQKSSSYSLMVEPFNSSGEESCWRWGKEKTQYNINAKTRKSNLVAKKKRDGSFSIYEKYRKSTYKPKSIWEDNSFLNETGTLEMKNLGLGGIFDFPKPIQLIKHCISLSCESNDIILDFFSGSCPTAHAMLDVNREKNSNNKFIMVQLPEPCEENSEAFKAGYKTIADIGKERIRRVIKKIEDERAIKAEEAKSKLPGMGEELHDMDLGFKVLKLDKSNFKIWDGSDPDASEEKLKKQLELHVEHIDTKASQEDILFELLLKAGFMPTVNIEKQKLAGKTVYSIAEGTLVICLEDEINKELIGSVAESEPNHFICLDRAFQGNDQLKANAAQTFAARNQGRDKAEQIIFRTI